MLSPSRAGTMIPLAAPLAMNQGEDPTMGKMVVIGAYIFMILANGISFTGIFESDIGEISNEYPTYITPDGLTFSIWGVIYSLLLVLSVAQCCASPDTERILAGGVRYRIALAFVLNGLWLPTYSAKWFGVALLIIAGYLATLVSVVLVVNARTVSNMLQWFLYAVPISTNASWVLVATLANTFTVAGEYGWKDENGVAGSVPAAVLVVMVVTAVGSCLAVAMLDVAWSLVAAWALRGIFRMQSVAGEAFPQAAMSSSLATWANVGSVVVLVAAEVGLVLSLYMAYKSTYMSLSQMDGGPLMPAPDPQSQGTPFCLMMGGWAPGAWSV